MMIIIQVIIEVEASQSCDLGIATGNQSLGNPEAGWARDPPGPCTRTALKTADQRQQELIRQQSQLYRQQQQLVAVHHFETASRTGVHPCSGSGAAQPHLKRTSAIQAAKKNATARKNKTEATAPPKKKQNRQNAPSRPGWGSLIIIFSFLPFFLFLQK